MNVGETPATAVYLAPAAGWLRASWSTLRQCPCDCEPASLLCVGSWETVSWLVFLVLADCFACRNLAIAICTQEKLAQCKHSCNWLDCWKSAFYTLSLVVSKPVGVGAAVVCADWLGGSNTCIYESSLFAYTTCVNYVRPVCECVFICVCLFHCMLVALPRAWLE
jgi:hypothetical protein